MKTYLAVLARRRLFSSTKREYQGQPIITLCDFLYVCRVKGTVKDQAQTQFAWSFGLTQNDREGWFVNKKALFPECALWGLQERDDITSSSDHSEVFHRVLNMLVLDIWNLTPRMAKATEILKSKIKKNCNIPTERMLLWME
jgi:hypothetical protein